MKMDLLTAELNKIARTEAQAYQREIERSRHQMMQEISGARHAHGFSRKADLHIRHAEAQHVLRTHSLELAILAINERLADAAVLEGPQPIAATRR